MNIGSTRIVHHGVGAKASSQVGPAASPLPLLAVQAQDYLGSLWAIGVRTGYTEKRVEDLLKRRILVRSWPMRGTLHIVAATDLRWMLGILASRTLSSGGARLRQLGIDAHTLIRAERCIVRALEGGKCLPREELYGLLDRAGISTDGQRGYHLLVRLSVMGLLCLGPRQGKSHTFALLEEWIAPSAPLDREASLSLLARRYFAGHGPATVRDLSWWSGLNLTEARRAIELAKVDLEERKIAGESYWIARDQRSTRRPPPKRRTHLLPSFDEILLGYRDRRAAASEGDLNKVHPGKNGMFLPILVHEGRVKGTWKRTLKKDSALVVATVWDKSDRTALRPSLQVAAEDYGAFLGAKVFLKVE